MSGAGGIPAPWRPWRRWSSFRWRSARITSCRRTHSCVLNRPIRALAVSPVGVTNRSKTWGDAIAIWLGLLGSSWLIAVNRRSRGMPLNPRISFKRKEREPYYLRPLQPLGDWGRTFAIVAGIIEVAGGVAYLVAPIQARVWEAEPVRPGQLPTLYCMVYWGYAILQSVVRDYRLVNYGASATPIITAIPQANKEMDPASRAAYEKARAAMETWDQRAAIQIYRDAGLAKADAMVAVMHIGKRMRAERPEGSPTLPCRRPTCHGAAC